MADGSTTIEYGEGGFRGETSDPNVNGAIAASVLIVSGAAAVVIVKSAAQITGDSVARALAESASSAVVRGFLGG